MAAEPEHLTVDGMPTWAPMFLADYVEYWDFVRAARVAGVDVQAVYDTRRSNPSFAAAIANARSRMADWSEARLMQLVKNGDTNATIFANKNLNPAVYSDRLELRHTGTIQHALESTGGVEPLRLDPAKRREMARLLMEGSKEGSKEGQEIVDAFEGAADEPQPDELGSGAR